VVKRSMASGYGRFVRLAFAWPEHVVNQLRERRRWRRANGGPFAASTERPDKSADRGTSAVFSVVSGLRRLALLESGSQTEVCFMSTVLFCWLACIRLAVCRGRAMLSLVVLLRTVDDLL
jgi:hypothetical protein